MLEHSTLYKILKQLFWKKKLFLFFKIKPK